MSAAEALRDAVADIIRDVASAEILPRFRNLADHEISEKGRPGDLVTAADVAAEAALAEKLTTLLPASAVVGEEAAEGDETVLDALAGTAPVWVLDPVDGTRNFAQGKGCFAVIVALVRDGETEAGWIYDPVDATLAWAAAGEGAWLREGGEGAWRRLRLGPATSPVQAMKGSLPQRLRERLASWPGGVTRYFCVGHEYLDLARGVLGFAVYGGLLKPWDHAAGVLLYTEAGGRAALVDDDSAYRPIRIVKNRRLLLAPDPASWQSLRSEISGG